MYSTSRLFATGEARYEQDLDKLDEPFKEESLQLGTIPASLSSRTNGFPQGQNHASGNNSINAGLGPSPQQTQRPMAVSVDAALEHSTMAMQQLYVGVVRG